jgi:hypothetical protein
MDLQDCDAVSKVRTVHEHLAIKPPRTEESRIEHFGRVSIIPRSIGVLAFHSDLCHSPDGGNKRVESTGGRMDWGSLNSRYTKSSLDGGIRVQ